MASSLMTGLTAASYQRYIRGPGKLYRNFTSYPTSPGTLLGATRGGSEFSWGMEYYDVVPDGVMGFIRNHRLSAACKPTLKVNLFEWTANNLLYSVGGANSADQTPLDANEYVGTGATITVGIELGASAAAGQAVVDESTLNVWYTDVGLGALPTLGVLGTDYSMVDQVTMSGVAINDTVILTGSDGATLTYTAKGAEDLTAREFNQVGTDAQCATSFAACVNSATYGSPGITATAAAAIVSLTRPTAGTANTITVSDDTNTIPTWQVVLETITGSIVDTDLVTAEYTYDSVASGDTYTVVTAGQLATADYWDNIALVCELSNQSYTAPYVVFIVKNVLSNPDVVPIPGERAGETVLATTFEGFFDPADGLTLANSPVEVQIGIT